MVLTRDHGYNLDAVFAEIDADRPIQNKDPEHFKCVVTGVIALDKGDGGFASILGVKMDEVYKYFKKLVTGCEVRVVNALGPRPQKTAWYGSPANEKWFIRRPGSRWLALQAVDLRDNQ